MIGTIGFSSCFISFPYFYALKRNSPHAPVFAARQICELNDHGYLFYVTHEQYWLFHSLFWGGWTLGAAAALLNYRWKAIKNLTPRGWEFPK